MNNISFKIPFFVTCFFLYVYRINILTKTFSRLNDLCTACAARIPSLPFERDFECRQLGLLCLYLVSINRNHMFSMHRLDPVEYVLTFFSFDQYKKKRLRLSKLETTIVKKRYLGKRTKLHSLAFL